MITRKIPYGISNFEAIVSENYYFVDKTSYIELTEQLNEKYLFFLRPRKFGKSLFVSMLHYYYGIEHKEKFQKLFGDFYIGKNPTQKAGSYFILKFDFSGIETHDAVKTYNGFKNTVHNSIDAFLRTYNLLNETESSQVLQQEGPNEILKTLFAKISNKIYDKKLFILIDEYDHFTNELLSFRMSEFREIVSGNGYVRKFYEVIKTGTANGIVDRFFATGVTPVTLDSLTSGFNIGKDKTTDFRFNEMLGFTEDEVKRILDVYEIDDKAEILNDLGRLYNGSMFSPEGNRRLYNSNMILYFLSEYLPRKVYPRNLIDSNIASDYGKIKNIFYINHTDAHRQKLTEVITNGETTGAITGKYSFERAFTPDDFISLLYYNGLLTIKEAELSLIKFQIPNYVIREIYWSFFKEEFLKPEKTVLNDSTLQKALVDLAQNNNMQGWVDEIEKVLELLSNRDYQNFDEKYIKMLFISLASLSQLYIIKSEAEINGEYPDLMYLFRKPFQPNYQFLFELKYLRKTDSKKLTKVKETAKNQAGKYISKPEIQMLENLKVYAVVFVGSKGYFEEVTG